jgi:hypothetical protein
MSQLGIITPDITRPIGDSYLPELQGLPELQMGEGETNQQTLWRNIWAVAATASFAASIYHGYKRNDSLGWGLWWGLMGAIFPVVTPVVGIAQGFGKRKR